MELAPKEPIETIQDELYRRTAREEKASQSKPDDENVRVESSKQCLNLYGFCWRALSFEAGDDFSMRRPPGLSTRASQSGAELWAGLSRAFHNRSNQPAGAQLMFLIEISMLTVSGWES